jgi:hypothetical protein
MKTSRPNRVMPGFYVAALRVNSEELLKDMGRYTGTPTWNATVYPSAGLPAGVPIVTGTWMCVARPAYHPGIDGREGDRADGVARLNARQECLARLALVLRCRS